MVGRPNQRNGCCSTQGSSIGIGSESRTRRGNGFKTQENEEDDAVSEPEEDVEASQRARAVHAIDVANTFTILFLGTFMLPDVWMRRSMSQPNLGKESDYLLTAFTVHAWCLYATACAKSSPAPVKTTASSEDNPSSHKDGEKSVLSIMERSFILAGFFILLFKLENIGESSCRLRRISLIRKDSIIQHQKRMLSNWMFTTHVTKTELGIDISNKDLYTAFLTIYPQHTDFCDMVYKRSIHALRKEGSERLLEVVLASDESKSDFKTFRDEYVLVVEIALSAIRNGRIITIWDDQMLPLNGDIWMNTNIQAPDYAMDEDMRFVEITLE